MLVGYATSDDAGVYKLNDELAIVQTVDFFTPIVDDPYDFGRIAAANALSDVYAMGGVPVCGLNIVAFPLEELGADVLEAILLGGAHVAQQAGVVILGGHTIKDAEPKYGLAVTGTIHPARIVTNAGARPGDILALTKPLGTGVLATALRRGSIGADAMAQAVSWMSTLNDRAATAMLAAGAHAATDITGFGLLGHANEIARASRVSLAIDAADVPLMDGVADAIARGDVPGGTNDNAAQHRTFASFSRSVPESTRIALSDAQTSGGLLVCLPPEGLAAFEAVLDETHSYHRVIGEVRQGEGIVVR